MGPLDGGPLAAMDSHGKAMGQAVGTDLVALQHPYGVAVVHAHRQGLLRSVETNHRAGL